jgi:hypothetical protein
MCVCGARVYRSGPLEVKELLAGAVYSPQHLSERQSHELAQFFKYGGVAIDKKQRKE